MKRGDVARLKALLEEDPTLANGVSATDTRGTTLRPGRRLTELRRYVKGIILTAMRHKGGPQKGTEPYSLTQLAGLG